MNSKKSSLGSATVGVLALFGILGIMQAAGAGAVLRHLALSNYFPDLLSALKEQALLRWLADYFPFVFAANFPFQKIIHLAGELLLVEPQRELVHDTTDPFDLVDVPAPDFDHLTDAFYTCPYVDADQVAEELAACDVSMRKNGGKLSQDALQ